MIKEMVLWLWKNFKSHIANSSAHHTDHKVASAEDANFKSVNIITGEAYKQNDSNILKGDEDKNIFIGKYSGHDLTTGVENSFIGYEAGYKGTTAGYNTFIGYRSGYYCVSGHTNICLGEKSGYSISTGYLNTFIGHRSGYYCVSGYKNAYIGQYAGYKNSSGYNNVFIGYRAGYYEMGSYKLIIASDRLDADILMHGEFNNKYLFIRGAAAAPADTKLLNSDINFWLDETNDRLQIKVKKSNGTVLTGNVQLS